MQQRASDNNKVRNSHTIDFHFPSHDKSHHSIEILHVLVSFVNDDKLIEFFVKGQLDEQKLFGLRTQLFTLRSEE